MKGKKLAVERAASRAVQRVETTVDAMVVR